MRINSKSFVKFFVVTLLLMSIATVASTTTYAAWWNPFSWFTKDEPTEEQKPKEEMDVVKPETKETQNEASVVTPSQSNATDAKTIEDLRAEIATLKASLNNLYKAHNKLVNDHNALLKYVKAIAVTNKITCTAINSTLDTRVSDVEKKLNDVCGQIFSSIGSLSSNRCPSSRLQIKESLESRIKKLEGRY